MYHAFMDAPRTDDSTSPPVPAARSWLTMTVFGIVLATFFSDLSHEAVTSVLPLYLTTLGLGRTSLGLIEGLADFLVSLSKLGGGVASHHVRRKRGLTSAGYLITALATGAIGLVQGLGAILSLRCLAWVARGFRGPLRDTLLSDAVPKTHYGRAFGLERAADMLGAVGGPLVAALLVWAGFEFRVVILWAIVPGVLAGLSVFCLTREADDAATPPTAGPAPLPDGQPRPAFPSAFWIFLIGVILFGLGDFSRTFLIALAAPLVGEDGHGRTGNLSIAVLLYALHNLISAASAYGIGWLGDRGSKMRLLTVGYAIGVGTNIVFALASGSLIWFVLALVLSGIYLAAVQTLEKAAAAQLLPRELRGLGFGILACGNAVGDMVSSIYVGWLLDKEQPQWAFGIAAAVGLMGTAWLATMMKRGADLHSRLSGG
jgi:MFS family permease